jgi:hypothetical protein
MNLIRHSMGYVVPREREILDHSFLSAFTALEKLVNHFRRTANLSELIEPRLWPRFHAAMRNAAGDWLKSHTTLPGERRDLVYQKLGELNRPSFSSVFDRLVAHYTLSVSDLWPVASSDGRPALAEIRNRMIHGHPIRATEHEPIAYAIDHLRWTVRPRTHRRWHRRGPGFCGSDGRGSGGSMRPRWGTRHPSNQRPEEAGSTFGAGKRRPSFAACLLAFNEERFHTSLRRVRSSSRQQDVRDRAAHLGRSPQHVDVETIGQHRAPTPEGPVHGPGEPDPE